MPRNSFLSIIFACCAMLVATDARAIDREDLDLSWCVPFTSPFDYESSARNFRGAENTRQKFEGSINEVLEGSKVQGLPFAILVSLFDQNIDTGGSIAFEAKEPQTPTDCTNDNDWTHGLIVQSKTKTVTNVTLCLQTSMAQTILGSTSVGTGRCNPEVLGLTAIPRVTLAELMAQQDDVFNRALGADQDRVRKIAPHLSFAAVYHETDVALLANRLSDASISQRKTLEMQLRNRAIMVMSQFIRVGVVPGIQLTVDENDVVIDGLNTAYTKIDGAVAVPSYLAWVRGDSELVIAARLSQPIERVRICQNCGDGEQDSRFAAKTSRTYLTGAHDDMLLSAEQIAPAQRDIVADQRLLLSDPSIQTVVVDLSEETLAFKVTPVIRDAAPRVSAGLRYSGAEGWEVPLSLQMPTPGAETKSNKSLSVTATEYGVEGSGYFAYTLQDKPAEGRGSRIDLEILASGVEDNNRLYGNTTGTTLTEKAETLDFGLKINYGSLSYRDRQAANNIFLPNKEKRAQRYWSANLRTGLRYQNVDLKGAPAALVGLDTGSYFGAYLSGDLYRDSFLPFVPRSASAIPPSWTTRFDLLFGAGGTVDEAFLRALVSSDLRAPFEFANGKAGFLRVGIMGGWVSDDAPTFVYLDAADPLFLQGLRQQEFMGRSFVGVTGEIGVDVTSLLSGAIPKTATPGADTNSAESQVKRRRSQEVLASVFADVGWMDDLLQNSSIVSQTKRLESYGLKLAIRQIRPGGTPLEVELGYAFSPQSIFQANGVFFVGLDTTF